jgi:hypothetical protein
LCKESIPSRSSSESAKSKTSKFSTRRSGLEALGIAETLGWSSSQRSATWPALLPVADVERVANGLLALGAGDLPGPEPQLGDGGALDPEGAHGRVDRCIALPYPRPRPC